MNPGDHQLFGPSTPLVHCPWCHERLAYVLDRGAPVETDIVLERHCPSCEYADSVVTSPLCVAVWYRRETRMLAELRELAVFLVESAPSGNALVEQHLRHVN